VKAGYGAHAFTLRDLQRHVVIAEAKLRDAKVEGHSDDTTFTLAYDAARAAAEAVMAAEGYRPKSGEGQHAVVFEFLAEVSDGRWEDEASRFNRARRKRNVSQYDRFGEISGTQAENMVADAEAFVSEVNEWLLDEGYAATGGAAEEE